MNADGVYLATYSALLLDLKLIQAGHYDEIKKEVSILSVCLEKANEAFIRR